MDKQNGPKLLTANQYIKDLLKEIPRAKKRIYMVATTFRTDDPRTIKLVEELISAAQRGVEVSICVDAFSYMEPHNLRHLLTNNIISALKLERRLKKSGVSFRWLGRTSSLLLTGRTHSKWTVVDDLSYTCGGCNMDNVSLTNTDYMFKFTDESLADKLTREQDRIIAADRRGGPTRNYTFRLNDTSTIIFDHGIPGNSAIYNRACHLAKESSSLTLVSQYCPTGKLNKIIKQKDAKLFFNHWSKASTVNKLMIQLGMWTSGQKTLYKKHNYLHAKFIIFQMPSGEKIALSGSHNFMSGSGLMGTREVALETRDPETIRQLEEFRKKYVE